MAQQGEGTFRAYFPQGLSWKQNFKSNITVTLVGKLWGLSSALQSFPGHSNFFSCTMRRCSERSNFILSHKRRHRDIKVARASDSWLSSIRSQEAENSKCLLLVYSVWSLSPCNDATHLSLIQKLSHRHAQRFVYIVIVDCVKMIISAKHHK